MSNRYDKELLDRIRTLAESGKSTREIGIIVGKSTKGIQKAYRRHNIHGLPSGCARGHLNTFWKGGIIIDKSGYVLVKVYNHPFASKSGYVRQHRLVMEEHLKRYLLPNEVVHHLDGNKKNNLFENLQLFQNNSEHLHVELSGKCPKWTTAGIEALRITSWALGKPKSRKLSSIPDLSKIYASK